MPRHWPIGRLSLLANIAIVALAAACTAPVSAQPASGAPVSVWVTLGANSGPIANPNRVVELAEGATFTIADIKVTAAVNGHYDFPPGSPETATTLSFAYRFDMPDRSIVYTGDTGPNANVEKLAKNVDMLISEITFEPGLAIARLKVQKPDLAESAIAALEHHFAKEHLSPEEAGLMAQRAGAKSLVFTHNPLLPADIDPAREKVTRHYKGPVTFAKDLDTL